jgi:hypothetical protein
MFESVLEFTFQMVPFERFVEQRSVKPCHDETKALVSVGSISASVSTSPGQSMAAAASARLALQTANKLKRSLVNGFKPAAGEMARVIHLKSS